MSMTGTRYSGYYMRDIPLPHLRCDGRVLVLCISPCRNPSVFSRSFRLRRLDRLLCACASVSADTLRFIWHSRVESASHKHIQYQIGVQPQYVVLSGQNYSPCLNHFRPCYIS